MINIELKSLKKLKKVFSANDDINMICRQIDRVIDKKYNSEDEYEYDSDDLKDATKYERERYGKRQFKGGSPLYPGKGATIVKKEGLLDQLKKTFGKNINSIGILNEESILDDKK